jgi:hypothetical protein
MRYHTVLIITAGLLAAWLGQGSAPAGPRVVSDAECRVLRERLAEHARLSEGVRRAVAAQAATAPAAPAGPPSAVSPADRATAIRARLAQIPKYQNLRGETVRLIEVLGPVGGGVALRRAVVLPRAGDQQLREETTTIVRPVSYWRTEVEVARTRETLTTAGAPVGQRDARGPFTFTLDR